MRQDQRLTVLLGHYITALTHLSQENYAQPYFFYKHVSRVLEEEIMKYISDSNTNDWVGTMPIEEKKRYTALSELFLEIWCSAKNERFTIDYLTTCLKKLEEL